MRLNYVVPWIYYAIMRSWVPT